MPFDLTDFVHAVVAQPGHQELLSQASQAASVASQQPAFAVHLAPGHTWEQASIADTRAESPANAAAVRSALFAIHRRLSRDASSAVFERTPEVDAIFHALVAEGTDGLIAVPLRTRRGRLTGAIVAGHDGRLGSDEPQGTLETIASLIGPALESAWQHSLARRDQERLQLFSETTDESLWDWNVALGEVWWGGNLEQLFGDRARVSKRPDWRRARVDPRDVERVVASFDRALGSNDSSWTTEYRIRGVAGDEIHVREHVYFLREVDGTAYRAIGTVRDTSALKLHLAREMQARAEAERASAVKDEFLAMLGHELRNPLAPIVSVLTMLERRSNGPDRPLEILRRQTQNLVRLVDDLLDVSRISSGKIDLAKARTSVESLVQRALEVVEPVMAQRRHHVSLEIDSSLEIDVDPARMTQALTNLLANAAKYTEPGGHIRVAVANEAGQVAIRIRDDGIGVTPEFLPTIFQMFRQGPQAIDRALGGLGLGLSIVANIVKLHGGVVEAHSEGAGKGTEIVVRLPPAVAGSGAQEERMLGESARSRPLDLLVVDDNEGAASMLSELLSALGHGVRVAHHPDDALRLFSERRPDVALLDIGLPSIDGYELARRMRAMDGGDLSRYVAVTGYGSASDRTKAMGAGFFEHVVKPVSFSRLERLIGELAEAV